MRAWTVNALLLFLAFNTLWFIVHSVALGWGGLTSAQPGALSRVFVDAPPLASAALALHMVTGAILTLGAPLQATPLVRRRWPGLHRRLGYVLVTLALVTGFAGLLYIAANGTVGGAWMSFWFAVYGLAVIWCAANTVYFAIDKDMRRHFAWATRLVILAVGSWIYRMHYGLWYAATGGLASNDAFTGLFDRVQVVAFFVPYLLIAEIFLRRSAGARAA